MQKIAISTSYGSFHTGGELGARLSELKGKTIGSVKGMIGKFTIEQGWFSDPTLSDRFPFFQGNCTFYRKRDLSKHEEFSACIDN